MAKKIEVKMSSGNIFADMGYENPEEALTKAKIAGRICDILKAKKLTQIAAAKILKVDQPRVSDLICGRLRRFSTEKLFEFLTALDQDIEIVIKPKQRSSKHAEIRVLAA